MQLNRGRFCLGNSAGFLEKPVSALACLSLRTLRPVRFSISIISAQNLPKPAGAILDPYVKIQTFGLPCDSCALRTETIDNNAHNPFWSEVFDYECVAPELLLVRFAVYDEDNNGDDFVGQLCVPFSVLRKHPGFFTGPLHDRNGAALEGATIFIKFQLALENPAVHIPCGKCIDDCSTKIDPALSDATKELAGAALGSIRGALQDFQQV